MASPLPAKDVTSVLIAAIGILFHPRPDREVLKATWELILGAIAIDSVQNDDTKVVGREAGARANATGYTEQ
ncbi:hypothetical protein LFL96_36485 (plasmid) [Paraburkholderia sp. D15]|uniref:hypothetical protein n=1 Tax=Paraburkholderia sp. D15 TaxID=2880218 RepID=UPI00247AFE1A|nr:hypothetical protein [Paraburkholderia sp. D15]WGS54981.1 hypothetical protein LFL96_36485 [Paraburkholderia sp. D15]